MSDSNKGAVTQQLWDLYFEEVRDRGQPGALSRVSERTGKPYRTVYNLLSRSPQWKTRFDDVPAHAPAPAPAPDSDAEAERTARQVVRLSDEVRELRRKLRGQDRQLIVVDPILDQMEKLISPIEYVAPPIDRKSHIEREAVDAVVLMSDQHADRVIRSEGTWGLEAYDFNVFRARLWKWAEVTRRFATVHLPNYKFETLWVFHLGDSVNGDIHDMKHQNHWRNSLKAALATGDAQAQALAYLASSFDRIAVVCVSGNHGRTTAKIDQDHPHDNFDYIVAEAMRLRLSKYDNVQVFAPEAWSAHVLVRGHLCHLNHGMGVRGSNSIPWYGFERREGRVQRLVGFKNQRVRYFFYGHFHTPLTRAAGSGKAIHAGAWYFTDGYSLNALSAGNEPEQQMLVFSDRIGRMLEIPIMLRDQEQEERMFAGKWEPPFGVNVDVQEALGRAPMSHLPVIS